MKVTLEFDLPTNLGNVPEAHKQQILFDAFTNYATICHLRDASKWMAKAKGNEQSTEWQISQHHNNWADFLEAAEKTMKVTFSE